MGLASLLLETMRQRELRFLSRSRTGSLIQAMSVNFRITSESGRGADIGRWLNAHKNSEQSQHEQLAHQWLSLAEQAEAETFNRRTLIVRDPVLLCAPPRS